ncbi:InlB B-repeat-containing protein [Gardnerella piotii]|uniref:InlB B-repeat-containing protein n=1 Tax=Gardnerella piotii TaxID=2792977 RepID=UPI00200EA55D|nr:InlB B-repeat-containing protein [Gardnerella piotii]
MFASSLTAFSKASFASDNNNTQNAQGNQNNQDIPGPFYGGSNVNSPLLEVGKYASLQISATNASGNDVNANSNNATNYSGTLTLNIPFNKVLNATKQQMESYKDKKAKLDFSYSLSLPEPIKWQENVTVENNSSLVTLASAKISTRHKNTIKLIVNLAENTWETLYNSRDSKTVNLTAHFSFTKSSLEQVQNRNITGTGILDLYEKDKNNGSWVPGFGFTYITHELNIPLLGGESTISNPLDADKQDYNQLIYSNDLIKDNKNKNITSTGKFVLSGTAQKVTYEDYSSPLITRDGLEISSKISSNPFKTSLENVEKWLKTKINDVSRVYVSNLNVSIKLTFKLPNGISLSPSRELPDDPSKHYPKKYGGVRNDPTTLLGDFGDFALKDVKENGNTITATAYLKDWYKGNQLMKPYVYSYDEIKRRINNLVDEINIKFIPIWFNTDAQAGKTYEIEGSAQGELSGKINYVYRNLGAGDSEKLIPFNVKFGDEDVKIPVEAPYKIHFKFESGTPNQTLPEYIGKRYALKSIDVYKGKSITIDNSTLHKTTNETFEPDSEVVGDGTIKTGTWTFDKAAGWKIDGQGEPVTTIENVNKNITLVGTWKFIPVEDSAHRKVTFKNGEKTIATVEVEAGKNIENDSLENQSMPANPTKVGYTFKEWNTKADGTGAKFLSTTNVIYDIKVYAVYTKDSNPQDTHDPDNPKNPEDSEDPQNPQDPNNNSESGSILDLDNGSEDGSNHKSTGNQLNNANAQNGRNNKSESLESSNSDQTNNSANSNKSGAEKLESARKNTLPRTGADNSPAIAITIVITIAALIIILLSLLQKAKNNL